MALPVAFAVACTAFLPQGSASTSSLPVQRSDALVDPLAGEVRNLDPKLAGWDTEAFNTAAGGQLSKLAKLFHEPSHLHADQLQDLIAPAFECNDLRPDELRQVFSSGPWSVKRGLSAESSSEGAEGLARALADLGAPYGDGHDVHVKTKIVRVTERGENRFEAGVLLHVWGDAGPGVVQQTCDWSIEWTWPDRAAAPRMSSVRCTRYDEVRTTRPILRDCTEAVIGTSAAWKEQLLRGTDDWCRRISLAAGMNQYAHNGLAVGDVDGDGLEDLYVCQGGGLPNRLFRHLPDGTAEDIAARAGVDFLDETMGALILDLDDDGRAELVLSTPRALLVMKQDEKGVFAIANEIAFPGGYSLAAADYDRDGLIDLYVCRYTTANEPIGLPSPYHDANNGPPNALYENRGGLRFEDVTASSGIDQNNRRFSFAASWADYDQDGDLDLYVANDFGRNNLYRNEGGKFRDVAAEAGVEDISAGMGASWGDFDGDRQLDLYVSNMFSSAGLRVAYQRNFRPGEEAERLGEFQRHARGNSLFKNRGDGTFDDVTMRAGVNMGRWAWGAQFVDLDGDGRQDLFVPNGFITNEDTEDL